MATKTPMLISKGTRYKAKEDDNVVIVFFVDLVRSNVRFSNESGATGREFSMDLDDFRNNYVEAGDAPVEKAAK